MKPIEVDIRAIQNVVSLQELDTLAADINLYHQELINRKSAGSEFTGWLDLPAKFPPELLTRINDEAARLRHMSDVVVVVGIGGSYLGARAVIDALQHNFASLIPPFRRPGALILYAGNNIGEEYLAHLVEYLHHVNWSMVVISKSGTTTEPAIAFRILKHELIRKYSLSESRRRIVAITDQNHGALRKLANSEGYATFVIPDDIGGRYSVLTPVGLLPVAIAGFNIQSLLEGAADMQQRCMSSSNFADNPAAMYAAARNALYRRGKPIEILVNYLPNLFYITEWWKQLFGESEGKQQRGIFPAGVSFTTDLHSMGQYIQEGLRVIFETVLSVDGVSAKVVVPFEENDADGLNYLAGKRLHDINKIAETGTLLAHVEGEVPNIRIHIPSVNEYYLGNLMYFFEFACALSGYVLQVNPFDQPGVEAYKKNMFALLGKPGFEAENKRIQKELEKLQ